MSNGVRYIRESILGVKRKTLAEALKITPMAISNYENNLRDPEIPIAHRMVQYAQKLGKKITLDDIYPINTKSLTGKH